MTATPTPVLSVRDISKGFTLHLHGGTGLPVVEKAAFDLFAGECVVLGGPSGAGKSSILKMIYGNYLTGAGEILLHHDGAIHDVALADARTILAMRRLTMGYVSQFLRVIPRVATLDLVAQPALAAGLSPDAARERAAALLMRLNLPERLWSLPPATFSGGEQQRVNIARGFAGNHGLMILDEPTASLDATNRDAVLALIQQRKAKGMAFLGIFHDQEMRERVADRVIDVSGFAPRRAVAA
jgi:alpha-D-ribose 1-methylphosphonate 5-triphosphate synthase subunit PhnL